MSQFTFEAMDAKGQKLKKEIEAANRDEALSKIRGMGYFPTKVKEKSSGGKKKNEEADSGLAGEAPKGKRSFVIGGVSAKQLTQFTTQLYTLQDAGLPIVRSIRILEGQLPACTLKNQLMEIAEDVESGSTLAEAFAKHPKTFNHLFVSMVKAGEKGGVLDTILERLATFMEKSLRLKKKVIGAMVYPAVVTTVAVGILFAIMKFVIPSFKKMFDDQGLTLPPLTEMLLGFSSFVADYWWLLIVAIPLALYAFYKGLGLTASGRLFVDHVKIKTPLFGTIVRKSIISRFCRTLGTLLASGVPILEALSIIKDAIGNQVITRAVEEVHGSIREGESISQPLRNSGVFDELVINMIDVGEETGELDRMLMKVADNYDEDVDIAVESLTSVLEPIMIVGLGGSVGFIVIALFMPLIELMDKLGA